MAGWWGKIWNVLVFVLDVIQVVDIATPPNGGGGTSNDTALISNPQCVSDTFTRHKMTALDGFYESAFLSGTVVCVNNSDYGNETCVYDYRSVNTSEFASLCTNSSQSSDSGTTIAGQFMLYDYIEVCSIGLDNNETDAVDSWSPKPTRSTIVLREAFCVATSCAGTADELEALYAIYHQHHNRNCSISVSDVYSSQSASSSSKASGGGGLGWAAIVFGLVFPSIVACGGCWLRFCT